MGSKYQAVPRRAPMCSRSGVGFSIGRRLASERLRRFGDHREARHAREIAAVVGNEGDVLEARGGGLPGVGLTNDTAQLYSSARVMSVMMGRLAAR